MDRMDKLTTLFESDEQLYFCVGLIILVGAIVIICAMVNDYREYLGSYNIVVFLTICISYANNCFTL